MIDWLVSSRVGRWIAALVGIVIAVLAARAKWRYDGAADERQAQEQANDRARGDMAERIDVEAVERDRSDAARDQRLRDAGLL